MPRRSLPVHVSTAPGERPRRALPVLGEVRDVDRAARPRYAVWEITLRCDLACRHCGSRAGAARDAELTTAEALDLVDQMADLGVEEVSLIGGEAYLRDDWLTLARRVHERGMLCGVVTGGRGLSRERALAAKQAGVNGVSVSVDGLEPTHDWLRGVRGSHRAAMEALANLEDAGLARAVNTQVNRTNLHEIPAVFDLVAPRGIYGWQVQFTVAMGRAADRPEILLQPWEMLDLVPMVARLSLRARERGIRLAPGNNVGYYGPFEEILRRAEGGHHESCSAGRTTLGLEANGDVKGCPSLPSADYVGGNVRDLPLREIWERSAPLRFTRGRTREDLWGFCRDCYYADHCLAGCTWTSHVLFGRRGNNPYCHHRALELLERGRRERLVQVERPAGEPFDYGRFELVEEGWPEGDLARARALAEG